MEKKKTIFALMLAAIAGAIPAHALSVRAQGAWRVDVDSAYILTQQNEKRIVSPSAQVLLSIDADTPRQPWRIDVHRDDRRWHPDLHLSVRRTDDGSGSGKVEGGIRFQEIGPLDLPLMEGQGDRSGIGLQYAISGVSILIPPEEYAAQIIYTVVEP